VPRKIDRQAKKETISGAAMRVFRQTGYHRARMNDIIRFEFERYFQAFREGALEALRRAQAPGPQLTGLVAFALSHVEAWRGHCSVYIDYFTVARTQERQERFSLENSYEEMRDLLRGLIERGQANGEVCPDFDPAATASLLISLYDGVVLHDLFDHHEGSLPAMRAEAMRLITRALLLGDEKPGGTGGERERGRGVQLRLHEDP
jgi:AcrR family transcriptional regulator